MKGSDKLPGLLSYCGAWVKPVTTFETVEAYRAGMAAHDFSKPFIILDVPSLKAEEAASAAKVNFSLFKAGYWAGLDRLVRMR